MIQIIHNLNIPWIRVTVAKSEMLLNLDLFNILGDIWRLLFFNDELSLELVTKKQRKHEYFFILNRGHSIATWTSKVDRYYSKDAFLTTSRENRTGKSFSPIICAMDEKFYSFTTARYNTYKWRCLKKLSPKKSKKYFPKLSTKLQSYQIVDEIV